MTTASSTASTSTEYRVTSLSESGEGYVTVNFTQVATDASNSMYGNFSRTFSSSEASGYFPGQVYTMTLTKKS